MISGVLSAGGTSLSTSIRCWKARLPTQSPLEDCWRSPGHSGSEGSGAHADCALRWQVMGEKVRAVRELWTRPEAEFHGRFADFGPVVRIRPFQSPHPPVLVGSHGPAGLRRVAQYGDEWFPWFPDLAADLHLEDDMRELARLCAGAGREPARVTVVLGGAG